MAIDNKLGITSSPELAEAEERISKKKAILLFEDGTLDKLKAMVEVHVFGWIVF